MEFKKIELMRYRNFGDLFSTTFDFIKQNFKLYLKTVLIYIFPFLALVSFGIGFIFRNFSMDALNNNPDSMFNTFLNGSNIAIMVVSYLILIIVTLLSYAITFAYVNLYKKRSSINEFSAQDVWNNTTRNIGWMLGYSFIFFVILISLYAVLVFLTATVSEWFMMIFFIMLPFFIYISIPLSLLFPLKFEEPQLGFGEAVSKCFKLIKGKWWESFGFMVLFSFLIGICSYAFIIPAYIVVLLLMLLELGSIAKFISIFGIGIFYSLMILINGFAYIAISVLFYSLFERLTGSSLKKQIEKIGTINTKPNYNPNNLTGI